MNSKITGIMTLVEVICMIGVISFLILNNDNKAIENTNDGNTINNNNENLNKETN